MSKKNKKPKKPSETIEVTKSYDIVRVDWNDHWSGQHNWMHPDDVDHAPKLAVTVGTLIKEDKYGLTIAQNMGTNMQVADTTYVIKDCIVRRKVLDKLEYGKQ